MDTMNTLALIESTDLATTQASLRKIAQFQSVIQQTLKKDHDFGVIPGTPKPTLYLPGAQKINMLMQVAPEYEFLDEVRDFDKGFFNYEIRCTLYRNIVTDGVLVKLPVCQGVGSCNSKEKKYRWTSVDEKNLPEGVEKSSLKKTVDKWGKVKYMIENEDPYTLANTILKMAKKRCLGSTTPVLVKTDRRIVRTNLSKLYTMLEVSREPIYLPGVDGTWREVKGMVRSDNRKVFNIKLADNSTIRATGNHEFPTANGNKYVSDLKVGDVLLRSVLPDYKSETATALLDFAFVSGLFLAEGNYGTDTSVKFTLNAKRTDLFDKIKSVAEMVGSSCKANVRNSSENTMDVSVYGEAFIGIIKQFVNGSGAKNKHLSNYTWSQGKEFIANFLDGYLQGDGHRCVREGRNPYWIIGFTGDNYDLADDIRCICAILNKRCSIKRVQKDNTFNGFPTFTGWIKESEVTYNQKDLNEIVSIEEETKGAVVYDVEVDGDHLFCLANGVNTHNSLVDATLQLASLAEVFTQDLEDIKEFIQQEHATTTQATTQAEQAPVSSDYSDFVISFGNKHKGETIGAVYASDPNYISYIADSTKFKNEQVNKAAQTFLTSRAKPVTPVVVQAKSPIAKAKDITEQSMNYEQVPFPDDSDLPFTLN